MRLGSGSAKRPVPKWREGASLILRNTQAGALQDYWDGVTTSWPENGALQLDGFKYERLGGVGDAAIQTQPRPIEHHIEWLRRDTSYTPQPYEQLAGVFREAGEPVKANAVLYASRERARRLAWERGQCAHWLGVPLLNWTLGYGLGVYEHLADGFRAPASRPEYIVFAGREWTRVQVWEPGECARWFGLSLLKCTIGYGIGLRYFRALSCGSLSSR